MNYFRERLKILFVQFKCVNMKVNFRCFMLQRYSAYSPFLPEGSLASELENTIKRDLSFREGVVDDRK